MKNAPKASIENLLRELRNVGAAKALKANSNVRPRSIFLQAAAKAQRNEVERSFDGGLVQTCFASLNGAKKFFK